MRAASRGVVDYRRARPQDPAWHRYANALITKMAADDELEVTKAILAYQCALVGNGQLTEDSFKSVSKNCHELLKEVAYAVQPWSRKDPAEERKATVETLIDAYKRLVGDPNDPEFQKKLDADAAAHKERMQSGVEETEEARIERLSVARDLAAMSKEFLR